MHVVQILDLADNRLASVPVSSFRHLSSLRIISLRGNAITHVDAHSFADLPLIESIDLTACRLAYVDRRGFAGCRHLADLSLAHNNLSRLSQGTVEFLPVPAVLRRLRVDGNPWLCDCRLRWLHDRVQTAEGRQPDSVCRAPQLLRGITFLPYLIWRRYQGWRQAAQWPLLRGIPWRYLSPQQFACASRIIVDGPDKQRLVTDVGANVTVSCVVVGDPEPQVRWSRHSPNSNLLRLDLLSVAHWTQTAASALGAWSQLSRRCRPRRRRPTVRQSTVRVCENSARRKTSTLASGEFAQFCRRRRVRRRRISLHGEQPCRTSRDGVHCRRHAVEQNHITRSTHSEVFTCFNSSFDNDDPDKGPINEWTTKIEEFQSTGSSNSAHSPFESNSPRTSVSAGKFVRRVIPRLSRTLGGLPTCYPGALSSCSARQRWRSLRPALLSAPSSSAYALLKLIEWTTQNGDELAPTSGRRSVAAAHCQSSPIIAGGTPCPSSEVRITLCRLRGLTGRCRQLTTKTRKSWFVMMKRATNSRRRLTINTSSAWGFSRPRVPHTISSLVRWVHPTYSRIHVQICNKRWRSHWSAC